jgi:alpha-beta hydrolase superfamily lysophospholipase
MRFAVLLLTLLLAPTVLCAHQLSAPSEPAVDSPELAHLGPFAIGVRTLTLVHPKQKDAVQPDAPPADRGLTVDIWYPAVTRPRAAREHYEGGLSPEGLDQPFVPFSVPGLAVRGATAAGKGYPLVVVSHGNGNATAALTWLTENLASKGYVVAAIRHEDPRNSDRAKFPRVLLRRPLDIGFVTRQLQQSLAAEGLIDPERVGLVGYSMGGYGVLTSAGAALDPDGPVAKYVPGNLLLPYTRSGDARDEILVHHLKAVVAMAPAGGGSAWNAAGLQELSVPLLLIAGNQDRTVSYQTGAHAIFEAAQHANRYLLTFKEGGHAIGLGPVPDSMRSKLWDIEWFEDSVWRKERLIGVNLHMITAFLDRYLKGDETRAAYLDGLVEDSSAGVWPADLKMPYGAYSTGTDGNTVWKGFQRNHAIGLELQHREAAGR